MMVKDAAGCIPEHSFVGEYMVEMQLGRGQRLKKERKRTQEETKLRFHVK
jgi:hypothetical protein